MDKVTYRWSRETLASSETHVGRAGIPGKVSRTSQLPALQPVQPKAAATPPKTFATPANLDPWLDAACRGTSLADAPVQADGLTAGDDAVAVQQAAISGVASSGTTLPHRSAIQRSFGAHDLNDVQAHIGGQARTACADMGALAYAAGEHVAFSAAPDLHTAAHEAAHVVQQRSGVSLPDGVGRRGDAYERHADSVADTVVAGGSAEPLLDRVAGSGQTDSVVQRFESSEHKLMGDEGARTGPGPTRNIELASGYSVSFGDITAMAGDFFADVEQIKGLAGNSGRGAGTREEVEYVRVVKIHGREDRETAFSQAARDAAMARYYQLAGANSAHFTEPRGVSERSPRNNEGNYRDNHENAVEEAVSAGFEGRAMDDALLYEGFASHFLTDAYASGHVRTERINISDWWNPKVPMFWENLKLLIAEEMAKHINDNTDVAGTFKTVQQLWEQVRDTIETKGLPTLTFGDLVSGAVHDYDNENGVATQHGRLMGDGRLRDARGAVVVDEMTKRRLPGAEHTENLAIAAVRLSLAEVERAYEQGRGKGTAAEVVAELKVGGTYAAEAIWPRARPDSEQPNTRPRWQQSDVASLVADPAMNEALGIFAREKAKSMEEALAFDDIEKLGFVVVSGTLQAEGFRQRITGPLRSDPVAMLQRIINYTPDTGGGVAGHDSDDNAMEYINMAREAGAMATLTRSQRVKLIRDLISGVCGDDEEQAIVELIETCSTGVMVAIVEELGGGDAARGIMYLDTGVDGAEWHTLKTLLRRADALKGLL